jgi:hypothetical protein
MSERMRKMRPMGIADILDETVELYKTSFVLLVGIAAVMYVPYAPLMYFQTTHAMPMMAPNSSHGTSPDEMIAYMGTSFLVLGYLMLAAPFVTGALTYAISERYLGRKVTIIDSFKRVFSASIFGQLLLAIIIKTAAMSVPVALIGFALVFVVIAATANSAALIAIPFLVLLGLGAGVGAFYLTLRLALLEATIVVENRGIGHALTRTWTQMRGSMIKCLGLFAIAGIVTTIVHAICSGPTQTIITMNAFRGAPTAQAIRILDLAISTLSGVVLAPVMSIVTILLYYDIRIRKEGFDLELLASELDAKTAAWSAPALPQEQPVVEPAPEPSPPESESSPQ